MQSLIGWLCTAAFIAFVGFVVHFCTPSTACNGFHIGDRVVVRGMTSTVEWVEPWRPFLYLQGGPRVLCRDVTPAR